MAVQPDEPKVSTRERIRRMTAGSLPFDPDRDLERYRTDLFRSDEELDEFIAEIYSERKKNLV